MKQWIKNTLDGMREDLKEFLPKSLIDVVEPTDLVKMHQYKCGNELLKEEYRIKSTNEYIEMMNWYEAKSKIKML
jgi:hypothetical protein|tara:strand:- start:18212 stop:18436 length:225 start_codon:yes stop_codon:yes gene_type:complete